MDFLVWDFLGVNNSASALGRLEEERERGRAERALGFKNCAIYVITRLSKSLGIKTLQVPAIGYQ